MILWMRKLRCREGDLLIQDPQLINGQVGVWCPISMDPRALWCSSTKWQNAVFLAKWERASLCSTCSTRRLLGVWRACLHPHLLQSFFQETQLHVLLFLAESLLCLGRWPCRRMLRTWSGSALEEEPSTVPACILFRYWVLWRWEGGAGGGEPPGYLDMTMVHSSAL